MPQNRQFRLVSHPVGRAVPDDFELHSSAIEKPETGEILVRTHYLSMDPVVRTMLYESGLSNRNCFDELPKEPDVRTRLYADNSGSFSPSVAIGEVVRALGIGEVVASSDSRFSEGDFVTGWLGVQEYVVVKADSLTRVDPGLAPLPRFLGALGLTGRTAYFGMFDVCQPKVGETVVVSAAAGATGSMVGQIARIKGCRAVGITGGAEKCRYLTQELGFAAAIDYKNEDLHESLALHCPDGVNVYFDNVGGEILDTVLLHLAKKARIAICGRISQLNDLDSTQGPKNYGALLVKSARMEGFTVLDYVQRWPEADKALVRWLADGEIKAKEHIVEGFEQFPVALDMLFKGDNIGKLILSVMT